MISVIIPVFNREHCIDKALRSALEFCSNFDGAEVIVVDDGSTDSTISVVESVVASDEVTIVKILKCKSNHGVSHARNMGMRMASNNYISFLDSDDQYVASDAFKIKNIISAGDHDLYCFAYTINGRNSSPPVDPSNLFYSFFVSKFSNTNSFIFRKSTVAEISFREGFPIGEDTDFWARLLFSSKGRSAYYPLIMAKYNYEPRPKLAEAHPFFNFSIFEMDLLPNEREALFEIKRRTELYMKAALRKLTWADLELSARLPIIILLYLSGATGYTLLWSLRNYVWKAKKNISVRILWPK